MSEVPVSKPQPSPYQRWEMSALGERRSNPSSTSASISKLAQEMMTARDAGHQQGYQAGLKQGRIDGQAQGLAQGLAQSEGMLAAQQAALAGLYQGFTQQAEQAREQIAQQLLDMAHALLKSTLELQPERLLPVIDHALHNLPLLQLPATLYLQPQDLELVKAAQGEQLAAAGWRLRADAQLARGGCRIETPSNEIDATLETRWRRLQQAFGLTEQCLSPL